MNTVVILAAVTAVLLATVVAECIIHHVKVKKLNCQLEKWQFIASEFKQKLEGSPKEFLHLQYVVTEEDKKKYKTDKALNGAVRSKLLMNAVNAIFKAFGEPERKGNQYDYLFRIQKVEFK